jgi:hypothetical protein
MAAYIKTLKDIIFALTILATTILFFAPVANTAEPQDGFITSFGNGKIKIRLYANYFCGPCGLLEPKAESILKELVKKDAINITFIDIPLNQNSSLYIKYFLYMLNEKRQFDHAILARSLLFEAAKQNITGKDNLEAFIKKKGIKFKPFDLKSVFSTMEDWINKKDKIASTPTCIIERDGKKEMFTGAEKATKALEALKGQ